MFKILVLIFLSLFLNANELVYSSNFEQAKIESNKTGKVILVIYTLDGCPACEYMKDVVFEHPTIKNDLINNFILLELDVKNKEQKIDGFEPFATPTIYFTKSNGIKIGRQIVGASTPQIFKEKLREIKNISGR